MEIVGFALAGVGILLSLIFGIILLVKAFQTNIWWGLGSLFIPFVLLIFVFMHWSAAGKTFLLYLVGSILAGAGYGVLIGSGTLNIEDMEVTPLEETTE